MQSIADGITGQKGNVHLSIGSEMNFMLMMSYDQVAASEITSTIKSLYKIHATNERSLHYAGNSCRAIQNLHDDQIEDLAKAVSSKRGCTTYKTRCSPSFLTQYSNPVL